MESLTIVSSENENNDIFITLNNYKGILNLAGTDTHISKCAEEDLPGIDITCKDIDTLKRFISYILSEYIVNKYEKKLFNKILDSNYYYFTISERKNILERSINIMNGSSKLMKNYLINSRKEMISLALQDYLTNNNSLNMEGFIRFRLKDYVSELENVIDRGVDEFIAEKEYYEFIKLLKYFVEVQESKLDEVNIVILENGKYLLFDEKKKILKNEYIKTMAVEIMDDDITDDDLLVSTLITIVPKKIVIHNKQNINKEELFETIKNVFEDKVVICDGCNLCKYKKSETKERLLQKKE